MTGDEDDIVTQVTRQLVFRSVEICVEQINLDHNTTVSFSSSEVTPVEAAALYGITLGMALGLEVGAIDYEVGRRLLLRIKEESRAQGGRDVYEGVLLTYVNILKQHLK